MIPLDHSHYLYTLHMYRWEEKLKNYKLIGPMLYLKFTLIALLRKHKIVIKHFFGFLANKTSVNFL